MNETGNIFDANKYSGKWVAFRPNTEEVVAAGTTLREALEEAKRRGVDDPEFYRVPLVDTYFVGRG